jgi:hypothetical protein
MYVIVFNDINEIRSCHQYASKRMILKNKHFHGNIFDAV